MDGFDSVLNISHTVAIKKVVQRRYMLMYNIIIDARDSMDGFDSVLNISHTVARKVYKEDIC